jgi:hypothetical protein
MTYENTAEAPRRAVGAVLIGCALASLALLANHPGGQAHDFAGVLKEEVANQAVDAFVHGGFIVVVSIQFVCFVVLGARMGLARTAVIAALVFTAIGYAAMSASMIADGLLTPAIAAKYAGVPASIDFAKSLFVLVGSCIRFLMPMALFFQAAGIAGWGAALVGSRGFARSAGVLGIVIGGAIIAALAATYSTLNPFVLMGGLVAEGVWSIAAGLLLMRKTI